MEKEKKDDMKRNKGKEDQRDREGRILTRRAPLLVILLSWPWQLKKGIEAECVPVQVTVWVQLRLLLGRGIARGEGESQVIAHLCMRRQKENGISQA